MKTYKLNKGKKALVLILSLAILFGAAAGIGISAADAAAPVSTFDDGYQLSANWIWADTEVKPEQWVAMRKTFTLDEVPSEAVARISADTKYWLWINGELAIFEGQLKLGDSRYTWYYDKEDISDYLTEGENTIAVQVYYSGKNSAGTVNSGVPAFLFEAEIGNTLVKSDTSWRAALDPAYEDAGIEEHRSLGESSTRYNAEAEMKDSSGRTWCDVGFDDSAWKYATNQDEKIKTNRMKSDGGGINAIYYQDSDPRGMLVLRSIPQWYLGDINLYTADGAGGTGVYTTERTEFAPLSLPGEYIVEAEVSVGTGNTAAIGICVCVSDKDNFYMPQIALKRSGSSAFDGLVYKPHTMSQGSWKSSTTNLTDTDFGKTIYDPQSGVDNRFDTKHTVRIEVSASTIKTYMNGQLLGTITDTKLAREGSTVGIRQDLDEVLRVYSLRVCDTAGNELYDADIEKLSAGDKVSDISVLHVENSKSDAALAKVSSNTVTVSGGEKYVTVRNCRVGITAGGATATYTVTNETNMQGTPYLKVRSTAGGELISIVSDSWKETSIRHQYVTRAGEQTYEALGWMNGYVFTFTMPAEVEVIELGFRPSGYDTKATGNVLTDNEILNQIYREAYDTLYICMRDTYMDCPDRERSQWWGDTVSNMQQAFYAMDENAAQLYAKTLKQVMGFVKRDGALPSKVANCRDDLELPMQSLAGVHSFWQYYLYSGDKQLLFEAYPYLLDYLDLWTVSVNGVISHRTGDWDWFDWGDNPDTAVIENCWYYAALECVLNIASLQDSPATAAEIDSITSRMQRIRDNFDAIYWNESKNAYYSETANGEADDRANALAVYTGLADKARYGGILGVLTSTYNASPYMEKYVLEAMYLMDAADEAVARTLLRYTPLAEDGYPTLTEYWVMRAGGTNNHAWTGGPLSMLYMYNAGITPITPGFETFCVRPQLGTLTSVNAYTVQGCGKIEVAVTRSHSGITLAVAVPEGARSALICVPRIDSTDTMITLGGAPIYLDGSACAALPAGISYVSEDVNYVSYLVTPGEYTFEAKKNTSSAGDSYTLTVNEPEHATVSVNGTKITAFPYTVSYTKGSSVTVVITPDSTYRITALTGSAPEAVISESALTRVLTLDGNKTLGIVTEAAPPEHKTLHVTVSDRDMARYAMSAYIDGNPITLPYRSAYTEGSKVTLTVTLASEDNYAVSINGKDVKELDVTVLTDTTVAVIIEQLPTVTEHEVAGVTVSKKSSNDTTWDEINLFDGIRISAANSLGYSTGFGANTSSVSITYDLGSKKPINQVALFPRTDMSAEDSTLSCNYPVDFKVSVSVDGQSYSTVLTVSDCANPKFKQQTFDLGGVHEARYVRLTVTKVGLPISGETSSYLQIAEFDVYYNALTAGGDIPTEPPTDVPTVPEYPEIPEKYSDTEKYPFALFMDGTFIGAYTHWSNTDDKDTDNGGTADNLDVLQQAKGLMHGEGGSGKIAYILLRRNYALDSTEYAVKDGNPVSENYGNYSQVGGTLVVDLGGNTLTLGAEKFITANAKATSGVVHNSAFEFKNGTIRMNAQPMIYYQSNSSQTATKSFDFTFDSVTFVWQSGKAAMPLVSQGSFSGTANVYAKIDFKNCTFDISALDAAAADFTVIDVNDAELDATVSVLGGKFVANAESFGAVKLCSLGKLGDLKFKANADGEYISLYMPEGDTAAEKPIPTDKGDKYFIRIGNAEYGDKPYATYALGELGFGEYLPKMSITLSASLVMNVYVPTSGTLGITFDGNELADLAALTVRDVDGKDYYVISLALPSNEAAREVKLSARVNLGASTLTLSYTFSIPEYARKVLDAEESSDAETTLVRDVLAYIRAAYVYFGAPDLEAALATIDRVLGDYNREFVKAEGGTGVGSALFAVAIILEENPIVRFLLPEGVTDEGYTFTIGGTPLEYSTGTMVIDGTSYNYAELSLSAHQLIREICYTNGTEIGSYHINSYYDFITTDEEYKDNANLITLVEKLYNYAKSAAAIKS